MVKVKPAATIMMVREKGGALEVLLLKRNKALKFAAGLWVFPGGKIEVDEIEMGNDEFEAAKLAAVRETKEEASVEIAIEDLVFFSHWTTPESEPRRFGAYFFFADVSGRNLTVEIDNSEIKKHLWINPQKALEMVKTGELAMMPPTYVSLQRIRKCQTIAAAKAELTRLDPIYILPVLHLQKGKMYCLYKGDAGYDTGNAKLKGSRHRMIANMMNGDFVFEYEGCEHILPVNGGMHC